MKHSCSWYDNTFLAILFLWYITFIYKSFQSHLKKAMSKISLCYHSSIKWVKYVFVLRNFSTLSVQHCQCTIVSIKLSVDKQYVVQSLSLFVLTKNRIRSLSPFSMYFRVITSCIVKYSKDSWKGPQFSLKLFSSPFKQASANVHKS